MKCPYCGNRQTEVVETRDSEDLETIRRRRQCSGCEKRFTTYERVENVNLVVIKKSGKKEQFQKEKARRGALSASEKTAVTFDQVDNIIVEIERELLSSDSVEVESQRIGEMIAQR